MDGGAAVSGDSAGRAGVCQLLMLAASIVFAVAVPAAVVYATVRQWSGVQDSLQRLSWPAVLLSLAMMLIGTTAATFGIRASLASVGHHVPVSTASQIHLIGLLAKYQPGCVWSFVLQMAHGAAALSGSKLARVAA